MAVFGPKILVPVGKWVTYVFVEKLPQNLLSGPGFQLLDSDCILCGKALNSGISFRCPRPLLASDGSVYFLHPECPLYATSPEAFCELPVESSVGHQGNVSLVIACEKLGVFFRLWLSIIFNGRYDWRIVMFCEFT